MKTNSPETVTIHKPKPVPIKLLPHREAPILSQRDGPLVFQQVIQEVFTGNFSTGNPEIRELIRQAGYVSLWFFLRGIAAYNGPYERLTNHLHVDLANAYQDFMYHGSWSAFFLPRSFYKTTVLDCGANAWELLRDPDLSIGLASAITSRAVDFVHETQRIFDSNELFEWLYPEYVPEKGSPGWNNETMILPNRTRRKPAPSLQPVSVGSSTQGIHVELMKLDDISGDDQLTVNRSATADMLRTAKWFRTNIHTLVDEPEKNRVVALGTRYGIEDPWEYCMENIKRRHGYWQDIPRYEVPDGRWEVYYRQAIENGKPVFPEKLGIKRMNQIRRDDPWAYLLQFLNNPYTNETAEFVEYDPGTASVTFDGRRNRWFVSYKLVSKMTGEWSHREFDLRDCDVVVSCDPAGTERSQKSHNTSRSVVGTLVTTPDGVRILADLRADYVRINQVIDWLFEFFERWNPRKTVLEAQGPFKILKDILTEEEQRRQCWIRKSAISAKSDKIVRIRAAHQPLFEQGLFFVTDKTTDQFNAERVSFPGSHLRDILDMSAQAIVASIIPVDPFQDEEDIYHEELALLGRSTYTGY